MVYIEKDLTFYDIMDYPIPRQSDFFIYGKKKVITEKYNKNQFSRSTKNPYMDYFINEINRHGKLYKSLPFVSEIYLCNSITFNALKEDSDIDIFIVAKKDALRRCRFFSALFFKILGLKRSIKNKKLKFCLSFYITDDNKNLYPIILPNRTDIYLAYRLAHIVPLYSESKNTKNLYSYNERFKSYLPNHILDYSINIGNDNFYGSTKFKNIFEFIFGGFVGNITERLIKLMWTPILRHKISKLGEKGKWIVIKDNVLKFHNDIREKISISHTNLIG